MTLRALVWPDSTPWRGVVAAVGSSVLGLLLDTRINDRDTASQQVLPPLGNGSQSGGLGPATFARTGRGCSTAHASFPASWTPCISSKCPVPTGGFSSATEGTEQALEAGVGPGRRSVGNPAFLTSILLGVTRERGRRSKDRVPDRPKQHTVYQD